MPVCVCKEASARALASDFKGSVHKVERAEAEEAGFVSREVEDVYFIANGKDVS
jgi:hypothetical protein